MSVIIGDNNKINNSILGDVDGVKKDKKGIAKELIIGISVTVIGGILLALVLGFLSID